MISVVEKSNSKAFQRVATSKYPLPYPFPNNYVKTRVMTKLGVKLNISFSGDMLIIHEKTPMNPKDAKNS